MDLDYKAIVTECGLISTVELKTMIDADGCEVWCISNCGHSTPLAQHLRLEEFINEDELQGVPRKYAMRLKKLKTSEYSEQMAWLLIFRNMSLQERALKVDFYKSFTDLQNQHLQKIMRRKLYAPLQTHKPLNAGWMANPADRQE